MMTGNLQYQKFKEIKLDDPFFSSLKNDYAEFVAWFQKKGDACAYTFYGEEGGLDGFLYLKEENDALSDFTPPLVSAKRLKVGTFKINPHGTRLGERFMKKIFDHATHLAVDEIYVTIFEKHMVLVDLFARYGFKKVANKISSNGSELVLLRELFKPSTDLVASYPLIPTLNAEHYLLSLYPEWHTRLLPDSILKNEAASIVKDVSHSNSIHKIYLAAMKGIEALKSGDTLVIYRTNDGLGPAHYRSVATSVCVVESVCHISKFGSLAAFFEYSSPYSVFTSTELSQLFNSKRYPWIIKFTYNLALTKRVTRKALIEDVGIDPNAYWGFTKITAQQLKRILTLAGHHESPLVY